VPPLPLLPELPLAEAARRLPERARHQLGLLAVDHWFDGDGLWAACAVDPGSAFHTAFPRHADWYRTALSGVLFGVPEGKNKPRVRFDTPSGTS
jgi:hypothetical protein